MLTTLLWFAVSCGTAWAGQAFLDIVSDPVGVDVTVNGVSVGKTPITGLSVRAGRLIVRAEKDGFGEASRELVLSEDEVKKVRIVLRPTREQTGHTAAEVTIAQDRGSLLVINKIGDVPVSLDGISKGTGSVRVEEIGAGQHRLRVGDHGLEILIRKDFTLKVEASRGGLRVLNEPEPPDLAGGRRDREPRSSPASAEPIDSPPRGISPTGRQVWELAPEPCCPDCVRNVVREAPGCPRRAPGWGRWERQVKSILVAAFDHDGSGYLSPAEADGITCDIWKVLDTSTREMWGKDLTRAFGFNFGYEHTGSPPALGLTGYDENTTTVYARIVHCVGLDAGTEAEFHEASARRAEQRYPAVAERHLAAAKALREAGRP